jgi:sugar lactone lactonase YvrE
MNAAPAKLVLTMLFALTMGCAVNEPATPFEGKGTVWPDAPNRPRIQFVTQFSNINDLNARPSLLENFLNIAVGQQNGTMVRPMAVAVSADVNSIFVADPDAKCVHRYEISRGRYSCLRLKRGPELISPVGLSVARDGTLFVSDSALRGIYQVAAGKKWLEPIELEVPIEQPTGIFWDDSAELLYVVDTKTQSVKIFDRAGRLHDEFGERGSGPGKLNFPTYLWADANGELLVTDSLNFRVQRFHADGRFIQAFGIVGDTVGDFARPKGIATDKLGHVYVVDALFHAMQIFDRDGTLLLSVGNQGQAEGEFWLPNGIYVSANNMIFVADSYNKRVQVFRYVGPET